MKNLQPKRKLKTVWIAIGSLAGFIALALGLAGLIQNYFISIGDEEIALTQVALQELQNDVLIEMATFQASGVTSGPEATNVAELAATSEALGTRIAQLEATRIASPEELETPIIIPTRFIASEPPSVVSVSSSNVQEFPFSSSSDQTSLAADWEWSPGASDSSNFRLEENGTLALITGPSTNLWESINTAPYIGKEITGNFQVSVRLNFNPTERFQGAGIALRSTEDPTDWIRIARTSSGLNDQFIALIQTTNNRSNGFANIPYAKTITYLKIQRVDETITFSASENGINWIDLTTDFVFPLPEKVQLFFYVYSTTGNGIVSRFSDLQIGSPQTRRSFLPDQPAPFTSSIGTGFLNQDFGWYPGSSASSNFQQSDNKLTIITGPGTNLWEATITSPGVEFLTTGDLDVRIKLDFSPSERYQAAGLGLRSGTDRNDWIYFRRQNSGGDDNTIHLIRTIDNRSVSVGSAPYADSIVYLRMVREEPLTSFYYSSDGNEWTPLLEEYVMGFPEKNWLFLNVFSTGGNGIQAVFSELTLTEP